MLARNRGPSYDVGVVSKDTKDRRFGFIGAGRMARALAGGFCRNGLIEPASIWAADPIEEARLGFVQTVPGVQTVADNREVVQQASVVVLSVKPQQMDAVMESLREAVTPDKLFLSIAAGITLERLTRGLGTDRCIRIMPNTPCLVGRCAAAYASAPGVNDEEIQLVHQLLDSVGVAIALEESLLDAVTGLSGSGPAFVYQVIMALRDGGVQMGLSHDAASLLAAHTVLGAAEMVIQSGRDPADLTKDVTSPGGTTLAGLQVLQERKLHEIVMGAVQSATERSVELGRGTN